VSAEEGALRRRYLLWGIESVPWKQVPIVAVLIYYTAPDTNEVKGTFNIWISLGQRLVDCNPRGI
jgi:hypothetical protein